jgi:hypothetical protein
MMENKMGKLANSVTMKGAFAILNQMKKDGVFEKYAIGGAVAYSIYLEPVTTIDVDIFVTLKPHSGKKLVSLEPIYDYLLAKGAEKQGQYIVYAGWPLQFLPADSSPLMAETLDRAKRVAAGGVSVWIFTQEHLAAVALDVGRPQDKTRLNALVKSSTFNAEEFKVILHRHGLERKYEDWLKWQRKQ